MSDSEQARAGQIAERLVKAQLEVEAIADALMMSRTSIRPDRRRYAQRLNAVAWSLRTAEMLADGSLDPSEIGKPLGRS